MTDLLHIIAFFAGIFLVFGGKKKIQKAARWFFRGRDNDFDIREIEGELVVWRGENPDKDFSDPEAQRLIAKCIKRIHRLREKNSTGDPEAHITKLAKLLK